MSEKADIGTELGRRLKGNVLVIGAGNTLRGDDGAGPALTALLEGKVKASLLDVGEVPESYFGRILAAQADTIVLVDAADFGAEPGDLAILEAEDVTACCLSTHQIPLDLFFRYIKEQSRADMFALGIQPARIGLGESMSPAVMDSLQALARMLQGLLAPAMGEKGVSR
jgi:hydrogenase 3 maturation protease